MALLVCFLEKKDESIDWSKKAIYLDQNFYEMVFRYYEHTDRRSPLREMVSIDYDGEYVMSKSKLKEALAELDFLRREIAVEHSQIVLFSDVLRMAMSKNCDLVIGGDMYPDLSRR
ncbi:MAG: hypothetical protein AAGK14_02365 [Verrucomicrobiota bacterium]